MIPNLVLTNTSDGVIHCLEKDCQRDIPLTSRVLASDGGKAIGFGSFSAFRVSDMVMFVRSRHLMIIPRRIYAATRLT
jgi:hypothetical protein